MISSKDLFESERRCQRWKWTTRSLRMWRDTREVLWRTPSCSSTSSRRTTWSSRSRKRYKCWFRTQCLGLILRRNLSGTWRWSRRCRNKRRGLWSCPGTPKLALMGFEHNNNVNHLWWFDVFFCKCYYVPLFFFIIWICQMLLCAKRAVSQNRAFPAVQEVDAECEVVYFHFLSPETWSQLCFCWTGQYMLC